MNFLGVKGVTPQVIAGVKEGVLAGAVHDSLGRDGRSEGRSASCSRQAILATLYALGGMLVYIAFRFEWIYGVAAVVAVFHDTIITIGLFSLFNKEISLTVVAALLTLVGYSMNDTIVVFDRIRENLKIVRRESLENMINISVNQTLSRTVLTSGLTLLTALSLFLFGGQVLNGFSFALVCGNYRRNVFVGFYRQPDSDILAEHGGVEKEGSGARSAPAGDARQMAARNRLRICRRGCSADKH